MRVYSEIKRQFSYLETMYGFKMILGQKRGSYNFILWTNEIKEIMVLYDLTIDENKENPIWIKIYDADCLGTYYDEIDEYKNEFFIRSGTYKDRICCAAFWLAKAIENKFVSIEN